MEMRVIRAIFTDGAESLWQVWLTPVSYTHLTLPTKA